MYIHFLQSDEVQQCNVPLHGYISRFVNLGVGVFSLKKVQVAQVGENSKLIRSSCCMHGALSVTPRQARVAMYNPPT